MKTIILIAMLSITRICISQENMISKSGTITFEGSVPSFEEVKATNNSVTFVLNPVTGEIASLALIKGFRFKIALMEEHFNENYMESDLYPKATFKGKIDGFDVKGLNENPKNYMIHGTLALHGKSKDIHVLARISKSVAGIHLISDFSVNASDFKISIPSIVKNKVANKINIRIAAILK